MTDAPLAVASAVILPEPEEQPQPPTPSLKRRQSSLTSPDSKRPRPRQDGTTKASEATSASPPQAARDEQRLSQRRKSGQLEERKRGQRLFGALLGTLSQSSSSTAQKRRTDIEKKQQTKLRQQTDEENEKKRIKLDALLEVRRKAQQKYDRQSYYKPWELLPSEEKTVKEQTRETEEFIDREISQYVINNPSSPKMSDQEPNQVEAQAEGDLRKRELEEDGKETDIHSAIDTKAVGTNSNDVAMREASPGRKAPTETAVTKDPGDDGGDEVVEGEEDTVIY